MLQQQLLSIDKLLLTCLVKLERIDVFTCEICHAVYCEEESLTRHLDTHVKCEDTLVKNTESYNQINGASTCATSNKTECMDDSADPEYPDTQQPYVPIRNRIMFEGDSDGPGDEGNSEDSMSSSSESTSFCRNENQPMKIEHTASSLSSEILSLNVPTTSYCNNKKSKPTPVSRKQLKLNPSDIISATPTNEATDQEQARITRGVDDLGQQFGFQTGHNKTVKQYSCYICEKSFLTKQRLIAHAKTHILDKNLKCHFCEKKFMFKSQLKVHQRLHNKERPYLCMFCNLTFRNWSSFALHKHSVHENLSDPMEASGPPTCELCDARFPQKPQLERHIFRHHITTGYPCYICKKDFGHPVVRDGHMIIHKGAFKCSVCGKCFQNQHYLDRCELSHKKPYECHKCNTRFGRKDHLTRHIKYSCKKLLPGEKEKFFKCYDCSNKFRRKDQLKVHMKNSCKPHKCVLCQKSFAKVASLTIHVHDQECKNKLYECDVCHKRFGLKARLARHIINNKCQKN